MLGPKSPKQTPAEARRAYQLAADRSFGLCEICGVRPATETHHRKYRSRGGGHEAANLLRVCGWGNHTGCHGKAHTDKDALDNGWSVASGDDPASRRVLYRGVWMLLTADGGLNET